MSDEQNPQKNIQPSGDPSQYKWGMAIHMSALIGLLLPLGLVLGPLLVWMLKKHESPFFDTQGKKAVNFQLTVLLLVFIFVLLGMVIRPLFSIAFMVGIAGIVFAIIAGVSVNNKGDYNYPFSFKIIK